MLKSHILRNLLLIFGKNAIGRTEDEKFFTKFIVHLNGKSFEGIVPKNEKGEYDCGGVMEITESAIEKSKECERKSNIFRRIVNGLWK